MASVLVAGATGYLGRYVVAELHSRGHLVRAVVRDRDRARREGPWGSPSLDGLVDELHDFLPSPVGEDALVARLLPVGIS